MPLIPFINFHNKQNCTDYYVLFLFIYPSLQGFHIFLLDLLLILPQSAYMTPQIPVIGQHSSD